MKKRGGLFFCARNGLYAGTGKKCFLSALKGQAVPGGRQTLCNSCFEVSNHLKDPKQRDFLRKSKGLLAKKALHLWNETLIIELESGKEWYVVENLVESVENFGLSTAQLPVPRAEYRLSNVENG